MKRSKVFVIPAVLVLFVVLPAMLYAAQGGESQRTVGDNVTGLSGNTWVKRTVDRRGDTGFYTSIAVDTSGKAHISYVDSNYPNNTYHPDLKYATNATMQ